MKSRLWQKKTWMMCLQENCGKECYLGIGASSNENNREYAENGQE